MLHDRGRRDFIAGARDRPPDQQLLLRAARKGAEITLFHRFDIDEFPAGGDTDRFAAAVLPGIPDFSAGRRVERGHAPVRRDDEYFAVSGHRLDGRRRKHAIGIFLPLPDQPAGGRIQGIKCVAPGAKINPLFIPERPGFDEIFDPLILPDQAAIGQVDAAKNSLR